MKNNGSLHTIRDYQMLVDQSIRHLGGYWRTLSGLARVTEEMGELAELFLAKDVNQENLGAELADVFIISTCLANQFAADLANEYENLGKSIYIKNIEQLTDDKSPTVHFNQLIQTAGHLARILNHYDGDKALKASENLTSVCVIIAQFHHYLYSLAASLQTDLFQYVEQTLKKNVQRDQHRFALTSDPITEETVTRFMQIKQYQTSLFQQGTRFWGAEVWDKEQLVQDNIKRYSETLRRFDVCSHIEGLDGLIIEVPKQLLTLSQLQTYFDLGQYEITYTEAVDFDYFLLRKCLID